jgi:HSP90 family molecular chaperone
MNERFTMMDDVLRLSSSPEETSSPDVLQDKVTALTELVEQLVSRISTLETANAVLMAGPKETVHVNHIGKADAAEPILDIHPMRGIEIIMAKKEADEYVKPSRLTETATKEVEVNKVVEAEEVEEEEEVVEEEAEEDGDAVELEEFMYKERTFYKDPENKVYMMDADGDLVEEPIGSWDEARKRVLFKR